MCCKQLIKTDTQISLSVLNNIANEIRKARLRLHKVEDKENMHFLIRIIRFIYDIWEDKKEFKFTDVSEFT